MLFSKVRAPRPVDLTHGASLNSLTTVPQAREAYNSGRQRQIVPEVSLSWTINPGVAHLANDPRPPGFANPSQYLYPSRAISSENRATPDERSRPEYVRHSALYPRHTDHSRQFETPRRRHPVSDRAEVSEMNRLKVAPGSHDGTKRESGRIRIFQNTKSARSTKYAVPITGAEG